MKVALLHRFCFVAALAAMWSSPAVHAQEATDTDKDDAVITVWGSREAQIGAAYAASEGVVDFGRFVDRPLLRVGELADVAMNKVEEFEKQVKDKFLN
ncbi:MAG: hypothetical protein K2Q06_10860, partial [Parvularculaceae bacterium]|nr:hypothetical protein [Parvularculaceae bacterium]